MVFDGTGYGCDETVWGGEFLLLGDGGLTAERVGHLGVVRLPGGDAGVRNPVRTAALALLCAGIDLAGTPIEGELTDAELDFLTLSARSGLGSVSTTSVGRLFDVVSALLGIRGRVTYEAQAAIELEVVAGRWRRDHTQPVRGFALPVVSTNGLPTLDPEPLLRSLVQALGDGAEPGELAWAFHDALAASTAELAARVASSHGVATIGLTGGVFANRLLLGLMVDRLTADGFEVLTHQMVPANDGGLALGQVAVGVRALQRRPKEQAACV